MTTPLVTPSTSSTVDDGPAIAELHRLHAVQRAAFMANPYPDADPRKGHLAALAGIAEAIVNSFFADADQAETAVPDSV